MPRGKLAADAVEQARESPRCGGGFSLHNGEAPIGMTCLQFLTILLPLAALSAPVQINQPAREVTREVLLAVMKDKVLASSSLHVVYTRGGTTSNARDTFTKVNKDEFRHEGGMEDKGKWIKLDQETCKRAK